MKGRAAGRAATAVTAMAACLPLLGTGAALAQTVAWVDVPNSAEAWYAAATLSCAAPVGCVGGEPASYAEDTLHVAVSLGAETARTYLVPDLARLPAGTALDEVTGGRMRLPVASDAGGRDAAAASLRACLVTGPVNDGVEASADAAPPVDCSVTAPLVAQEGATSYTLDLGEFLVHWAAGKPAYGVALLPAAGQPATAEWRVVLNARDRAGAAPITTTLGVAGARAGTAGRSAQPAPAGSARRALPATPPAAAPLPATQPSPSAAPSPLPAAGPASSPPTPVPVEPQVVTVPAFGYRGVVYLPLLFLVAIAFLARTFARPVPVSRARAVNSHERHA